MMDEYIIPVGLDYPDTVGFWDVNELTIVSASFMLFILIQAVVTGLGIAILLLYLIYKLKDHTVRGKQDHFLWAIGLITNKGFEHFPPPTATRFDE